MLLGFPVDDNLRMMCAHAISLSLDPTSEDGGTFDEAHAIASGEAEAPALGVNDGADLRCAAQEKVKRVLWSRPDAERRTETLHLLSKCRE